jgi:hypothetical protein
VDVVSVKVIDCPRRIVAGEIAASSSAADES